MLGDSSVMYVFTDTAFWEGILNAGCIFTNWLLAACGEMFHIATCHNVIPIKFEHRENPSQPSLGSSAKPLALNKAPHHAGSAVGGRVMHNILGLNWCG
jgi:hypothetical protein